MKDLEGHTLGLVSQEQLDRQLRVAERRILAELRELELRDLAADTQAWLLILAGGGPSQITIAPAYGVAPLTDKRTDSADGQAT